jgi:hypothetical protein
MSSDKENDKKETEPEESKDDEAAIEEDEEKESSAEDGDNKDDRFEDAQQAIEEEKKDQQPDDDDDEEDKPDKEEKKPEDEEKEDADQEPKMELRVEIRHDDDNEKTADIELEDTPKNEPLSKKKSKDEAEDLLATDVLKEIETADPKIAEELEFIKNATPESRLEIALSEVLMRKESHIERLTGEVQKLKKFISKRKQTYKRKRKDEGAPTRALSAYNIFVQDRFAQLAKENEVALNSADSDAQLKRVPPANLVAATGNQWKELNAEEKSKYEERAKIDRKRYEEQMAQYQPPDKQANRKRNKTGYNMFFSAHVLRLKQSEMGVPSERGSVARLVGTAWKVSLNADRLRERFIINFRATHHIFFILSAIVCRREAVL